MLDVLLVEDDQDLARSLIDNLAREKIICDYASNGLEGAQLIEKNTYNIIILDINMPGMDGLSLCRKIRIKGIDTSVLILTVRGTLEDKLAGFAAGADDYMVKPYEIKELIARLNVLAKRRSGQITQLVNGPLRLDLNNRKGMLYDQEIVLTPTSFTLLETLLRASPHPVSKASLIQSLWGDDIPNSNKLRVHIHKLRKILNTGNASSLLKTSPGYGFYIENHT